MKFGRTRTLQSAKYLEQKRKKNIIALIILCICVASVILLCVVILRLPALQISTIEFSGISNLKAEELKEKTLETFKGNYLYFIPQSNRFFYSKKDIKKTLINSFKKIKSLTIVTKGLSTVEISISERQSVAIACDGFKDDTIVEDYKNESSLHRDCFAVDYEGYIYDMASTRSESTQMKYYLNSDATTLSIGNNFLEKGKFKSLQKFAKDIKSAGISVKGILIGGDGSYELYFKNKDETVAVVYFDDRSPIESISSNLIIFWKNSPDKSFDYINLRFGNNIFFTYKGAETSQTVHTKR